MEVDRHSVNSRPSETAAETKKMVFSSIDGTFDGDHKTVFDFLEVSIKEEPESSDETEENVEERSESFICGLIPCKTEVDEGLNGVRLASETGCDKLVQRRKAQCFQEVLPRARTSEQQEAFTSYAERAAVRKTRTVSPTQIIAETTKTLSNTVDRNFDKQCRSTFDHAFVRVKEEPDRFEETEGHAFSVAQSELPAYHLIPCKLEFDGDSSAVALASKDSYDGFAERDVGRIKSEVSPVTQTSLQQEALSEDAENDVDKTIQDSSFGETFNCGSFSSKMSDEQFVMFRNNRMPSSGERFMEPGARNTPNMLLCISKNDATLERNSTSIRRDCMPDAEPVDVMFASQNLSKNAINNVTGNDTADALRQAAGIACTYCGIMFLHDADLKKHQTIHMEKKSFVCSVCDKEFTCCSSLMEHESVHTGTNPFTCEHCGKRFSHFRSLNRHQAVHTGEKPFVCSQCGKGFARYSHLKDHEKIHTGEKPFLCSQCGKGFIRKGELMEHQTVHTGEKPFLCSQCGKRFSYSKSLKNHECIHSVKKPFACTQCEKTFVSKCSLTNHERIHRGDKHFACSQCDKRFFTPSKLKDHMVIHTGERPYTCPRCDATFAHKKSLKVHERVHT